MAKNHWLTEEAEEEKQAMRDADILFLYGMREKARLTENDHIEIEDLFRVTANMALGIE